MKKRGKRILSLCLAVVIMATSAEFAPPAAGAVRATPSTAIKITENMATPSDAIPSEEKSTPSQATPSEEKATPSEAERTFVRVEPEEIPEYYSNVSYSGKKFWKFVDRYGDVQYRDYGFIQGEAEFPLWYEADGQGKVAVDLSINAENEYYNLAPYVYQSVTPDKSNWSDLSWRLFYDGDSILSCERKESEKFTNWNSSTYTIWSINLMVENDGDNGQDVDVGNLGLYFYGRILNDRNSAEKWYYADENGDIWGMETALKVSLLAASDFSGLVFYFDGKYNNSSVGPHHIDEINYYTQDGETYFSLWNPGGLSGYTFIGWTTGQFYNATAGRDRQYPQEYRYSVLGGGFFPPSAYIQWKNVQGSVTGTLEGVWKPNGTYYLMLVDRPAGYSDTYGSKFSWNKYIVVRNNGETLDLSEYSASKDGFVFAGWYTEPDGKGSKYDSVTFNSNVTLYAYYVANLNTVRFLDSEGNLLKEEQVYSGNSATPPDVPVIEGYKFIGWDKSYNNVVSDLVLTAQYKATNQLTIEANGGTVYGNETWSTEIPIGTYTTATITDAKTNSVREGYTFQSWYYYDEEGNEKSGYPTLLTSDLTIYIKWKANLYTITFNANVTDSSVSNSTKAKYYGDLMGEMPVLTRTKYKFIGWFTSPYSDGVQITGETPVPAGNTTYYAHWEFWYVDITYDDCIPDSTWSDTTHIWVGSTNFYNSLPSLTRDGYTLNGWRTEPDGEGDRVVSGWTIPQVDTLTLYAWWVPKTVYIYYMKNLTSTDNTYYSYVKSQYGAEIGEMLDKTEQGKIFLGWYTEREGGEKVTSISTVGLPVESYKYYLYAHWANENNTVIFLDWDGTILSTETVTYGESAIPPADPERQGYRFTGWDKSIENIQEDTTLTALYEISSRKLILDGNGGTLSGDPSIETDALPGESIDQVLTDGQTNASRKYYTFDGWYSDPVGGSKYSQSGNQMPETDLIVYAHWIRSSSLVTYKDWTGATINTQEVAIGADATPPAVPARPGYTFSGWDEPSTNIQDHTIITAQYAINEYKLILNGNGGSVGGDLEKELTVIFGESIDQDLADVATGATQKYYSFDGWYTAPAGGTKYTAAGNMMPAENVTVYAHWIRSSSLVTYKDWTGATIDTREVAIGADATPPAAPDRPGYTFTGWDKPSSNIQDHTTITAQYTINWHKLILDGNGGNIGEEAIKELGFDYGESFDQALADDRDHASRKYYTFDGWYSAPSGGSKYPESGNQMPDADVTMYAHWIRSSSLVTYKDWTGAAIDTQEVAIGADATPPEAPDRPGYTFSDWDKPSTNILDHTIITAQYTINGYLLTLDGNGGTIDGSGIKEEVLSYDESYDQVLMDGRDQIIRPGYTFEGWYTAPTGGSNYFYSGNQMPDADVIVYAHWTANTYEVTFDPDHIRWTGGVTQKDYIFDTKLGTLPAPEIYGWEFTGWWTGKNGSGTKITDETMVELRNAIYYGSWESVTYQIQYISKAEQPSGESVQTFTASQKYDDPLGTLPVPEEIGYTFTGWYDDENEKVNAQTIFNPDSGAEGYTYHAGWEANTYKIRFIYNDTNGIPVITEIDRTYPAQIGEFPRPNKPGYIFIGWFNEKGEEITAGSWVEPGDTEYNARWNADQYTIHFKRNLSGSLEEDPEDKTVTYGMPIGELSVLHEKGYIFLGWYTEAAGGNRIKETTLAALGDQTYFAHWTTGWIDNGNGSYSRPGADGIWNTEDDEIWWNGPDGISGTDDDKIIIIGGTGPDGKPIYYVDNGDGTHIRPGIGGDWTHTDHWWNGSDGLPGTDDDKIIIIGGTGPDGKPIYYVDNGDGTHIRPGTGGDWIHTDHWWNGSDGLPGTDDDKIIIIEGTDPDGKPIQYIDNGDGTNTRPGPDETWNTNDDEIWQNGPDDIPGTADDYKKDDENTSPEPTEPTEPTEPEPTEPKPTEPEPSKPVPIKESEGSEETTEVTSPVIPVIDSNVKPTVPDDGGTFTVNPDDPYDVTYTKEDGSSANNEWVGDGEDWYHVNEESKLDYDWYLEGQKTWYKLNKELGEKFGAALIAWNYEPMDDRKYFFDPGTTKMLTGWQCIDDKWYYFTPENEEQTYFGSNRTKWEYDPTKGRPYGSMYRNERTPDGYLVDENGAWIN